MEHRCVFPSLRNRIDAPRADAGQAPARAPGAIVQLVIAHFVWRFYSLLPTSLEEARFVQFVAEQHQMQALAV